MNNKAATIFAFLTGAALGAVVTWKLVKNKYEQIAQEEIDSVKEAFSNATKSVKKEKKENEIAKQKTEYSSMVKSLGYNNHSTIENEDVMKPHIKNNDIYVIPPESFGDEDDYEQVSLTYYADHVLTDEHGNIIENKDELIGADSLSCFGEYEDDSVFVRNDTLKKDFEILADMRNYTDVNSITSSIVNDND